MGINFTDIATTDPVVAATINDVLDELDAAIEGKTSLTDVLLDNIFINGEPSAWQRTTDDTGVTTTRKYVADRWAVTCGAGTLAHVRQSTTVRTGGRSKYSMELNGATGVTTVDVDQRIEAAMQGRYKQTLCFSCYVYNGSGAAFTPTLFVSTPSVADDWTSSTVRNGGGSGENLQSCADSAWALVYWTADVSGYTNINNGLGFRLRIPSGSLVASDTVRLAELNLVPGGVVTPFAARAKPLEMFFCQRYYEITAIVIPASGNTMYGYWKVEKRTTPGLSLTMDVGTGGAVSPDGSVGFTIAAYNSQLARGQVIGECEL